MQYIEPREATIKIEYTTVKGILSGSLNAIRFESGDETFLNNFPAGEFDTSLINEKNCTQTQQHVIESARDLVKRAIHY